MAKKTGDQKANPRAEEVLQESEEVEEMLVAEMKTVRSRVAEVVEEVQDGEDAVVSAVVVAEKADRSGCMEGVVRRPCLIRHPGHGVGWVVADDFLCCLESVSGVSRTSCRVGSESRDTQSKIDALGREVRALHFEMKLVFRSDNARSVGFA
jgi:hypothetical protein